MPMDGDPLILVIVMLFLFVAVPILCVFFLLRFRWWLTRRGFRPSYISLGNALQQIQATAIPQIEYALEEQRKERTDEDDDGGPDDPTRYYRRRMKQVDQSAAGEHTDDVENG